MWRNSFWRHQYTLTEFANSVSSVALAMLLLSKRGIHRLKSFVQHVRLLRLKRGSAYTSPSFSYRSNCRGVAFQVCRCARCNCNVGCPEELQAIMRYKTRRALLGISGRRTCNLRKQSKNAGVAGGLRCTHTHNVHWSQLLTPTVVARTAERGWLAFKAQL